MNHEHDGSELPEEVLDSIKLYWKKPNVFDFQTEVIEIEKNKLRLAKNYFYPEGGGQLSDKGWIENNSNRAFVNFVEELEDETWIYTNEQFFEVGELIKARIDSERRFNLSQHHSGQHLVSAVFHEEFDNDTTRAEIHEDYSIVELTKSPSFEDLVSVQNKISDLIIENLEISDNYFRNRDSIKFKLRGNIEDQKVYRIVGIGDYDFNPCGGTHVNSTQELGYIFFNKIEGKKLRFMTGRKGFYNSNEIISQAAKSSRELNITPNLLFSKIEELLTQNKQYQKDIIKLQIDNLKLEIQHSKFVSLDKKQIKIVHISELDTRILHHAIPNLTLDQIIVLQDKDGKFAIFTGSEEVSDNIRNILLSNKINSGGKGTRIMGKTDLGLNYDLFTSLS